jgi:hypothetical protein
MSNAASVRVASEVTVFERDLDVDIAPASGRDSMLISLESGAPPMDCRVMPGVGVGVGDVAVLEVPTVGTGAGGCSATPVRGGDVTSDEGEGSFPMTLLSSLFVRCAVDWIMAA